MATTSLNTTDRIRDYLGRGIYDQNEIFKALYPTYRGHYGTLRDLIAKMKNDDGR